MRVGCRKYRIVLTKLEDIESVSNYLLDGRVKPFVTNPNFYWGEDWYKKVFPGGILKK